MKLVITGKPEIGKTTIAHIMECEFTNKVALVPDAIDIVSLDFSSLIRTQHAIECQQRALYHLRVELENIISEKKSDRLILCDHGTLDGLALWPKSPESFFAEIRSSLSDELARYDWVLCVYDLEEEGKYFDQKTICINPIHYWRKHPRFLEIPAKKGFSFSFTQTVKIIREILAGQSVEVIRDELKKSLNQKNSLNFESKREASSIES